MGYEVIARKWRPRDFDEVVGQEHVTRTLKNALSTGRVAHAYLFVGSRGIGKTSVARIFAKALNCAEGPAEKPCGTCGPCAEISSGSSLDVIEIDGASNRGINEIRDLRESVQYMPGGRFKIYIIDEVHMLTTEAFNALLKTLEEPPAHVKFFFATTEPQKVPATILSRCQRFDFRRIPVKLIVERLSEIIEAEGVKAEPEALLAVARAAEGGLRDAESALDQLISFCGPDIKEEDVLSVFGLVSSSVLSELASALLRSDVARLIEIVEELDRNGKDMQRTIIELLEHFRNLLIFIHVGSGSGLADFDLAPGQVKVLEEQAELTHTDRLIRITDILVETNDRLKFALSGKTLFETALIRCARAAGVVSLDEIMKKLRALAGSAPRDVSTPRNGQTGAAARPASTGLFDKVEKVSSGRAQEVSPEPGDDGRDENELVALENKWRAIIDRTGASTMLARSVFMDSKPVSVHGNRVVVGFDPEFSDKIEQAGVGRNLEALKRVLKQELRRPVDVEFTVLSSEESKRLPSDHPVEKDVDGGTSAAPAGQKDGAGPGAALNDREACLKNKTVTKVLEKFNGSVIDVRK